MLNWTDSSIDVWINVWTPRILGTRIIGLREQLGAHLIPRDPSQSIGRELTDKRRRVPEPKRASREGIKSETHLLFWFRALALLACIL